MRKARVIMVSAGVCGVIFAAGGATAALADIPDSGVVHGCYRTTGPHMLSVIDTSKGQTCPSGTKALTWNQKGPPGPAGPAGPQGPAGPSGLSNTTIVQSNGTVAGVGGFESEVAICPSDFPLLVSGGYGIGNSQTSPTDYAVVFNMPINSHTWAVRIAVPADAPANVSFYAQALCAAQ